MSTSNAVRTPKVEYIDDHELVVVDSIEKKAYALRGYIVVAIDSRYHGHQYDNISITVVSDAKPRKVGTLPTYNIIFKCDGRDEKRKEGTVVLIDSETVGSSVQEINDETIITVESNVGVSSEKHEANEFDYATNKAKDSTKDKEY
ncbi:hypothetical protein H5410_020737 [Solanum commersonii]|uniref:Uncharacterized protein n=1 Tax=Solanum commersonii TaxID=4109 RepID=A0A9J5ZC59_SOLCO|nr:hypothetical protein H5410_020737 [Solanum commersonii]